MLNKYKVPKSGYINVFDYKSVKDLTDYLVYLSSNATAYNSYFKWKKHARYVGPLNYVPICDMCVKLNLQTFYGIEKSVVSNIENHWHQSQCVKNPLI
jgi:hypothetical protein